MNTTMAVRYLPEHEDLELLFDSSSEDEFEGFDAEDLRGTDANNVSDVESGPDLWNRGDRARPNLEFHARPGLVEELPADPQPHNFFKLFFKKTDFETMATETNRLADAYLATNQERLKPTSRFRKWTDAVRITQPESLMPGESNSALKQLEMGVDRDGSQRGALSQAHVKS